MDIDAERASVIGHLRYLSDPRAKVREAGLLMLDNALHQLGLGWEDLGPFIIGRLEPKPMVGMVPYRFE
jgi:hypothetical protein